MRITTTHIVHLSVFLSQTRNSKRDQSFAMIQITFSPKCTNKYRYKQSVKYCNLVVRVVHPWLHDTQARSMVWKFCQEHWLIVPCIIHSTFLSYVICCLEKWCVSDAIVHILILLVCFCLRSYSCWFRSDWRIFKLLFTLRVLF